MSLANIAPIKQYEIGIIVSRNFDNGDILDNNIAPFVPQISHIHTNAPEPGGLLAVKFARENAIPLTIWPTSQHAFASVNNVVDHSKFVYIITDGSSKVATMAKETCEKKQVKYRIIHHEPSAYWKEKVLKVSEILSAMTPEDTAQSETIRAINNVI